MQNRGWSALLFFSVAELWTLGQPVQIQSITDVSRGSIKRKKPSGCDAPSLNTPCVKEDEVATATKQLIVLNHNATGSFVCHAIILTSQCIHNNRSAGDSAVIIRWTWGFTLPEVATRGRHNHHWVHKWMCSGLPGMEVFSTTPLLWDY